MGNRSSQFEQREPGELQALSAEWAQRAYTELGSPADYTLQPSETYGLFMELVTAGREATSAEEVYQQFKRACYVHHRVNQVSHQWLRAVIRALEPSPGYNMERAFKDQFRLEVEPQLAARLAAEDAGDSEADGSARLQDLYDTVLNRQRVLYVDYLVEQALREGDTRAALT